MEPRAHYASRTHPRPRALDLWIQSGCSCIAPAVLREAIAARARELERTTTIPKPADSPLEMRRFAAKPASSVATSLCDVKTFRLPSSVFRPLVPQPPRGARSSRGFLDSLRTLWPVESDDSISHRSEMLRDSSFPARNLGPAAMRCPSLAPPAQSITTREKSA
jgi:hypothetical protein